MEYFAAIDASLELSSMCVVDFDHLCSDPALKLACVICPTAGATCVQSRPRRVARMR